MTDKEKALALFFSIPKVQEFCTGETALTVVEDSRGFWIDLVTPAKNFFAARISKRVDGSLFLYLTTQGKQVTGACF